MSTADRNDGKLIHGGNRGLSRLDSGLVSRGLTDLARIREAASTEPAAIRTTPAVGIDLGTTYSCIAYLDEHGEPISIPNQEGEISTPSVVMFDNGKEIVGTEALQNVSTNPSHVVQNPWWWLWDEKTWTIDGKSYTPVDVVTSLLRKLLTDAVRQIGPIERAVITVPAQCSNGRRLATVEAGRRAGFEQVDIIKEPVAEALCYGLRTKGLWSPRMASAQRILVFDLGKRTFDLSLVGYRNDQLKVIARTGDIHLGEMVNWGTCLFNEVCDQIIKEFGEEFADDLMANPESIKRLGDEVEQCRRSLTIHPKATLTVQHAGRHKTYSVDRDHFNRLTQHLVKQTEEITWKFIDKHRRSVSHSDLTILTAGNSSPMPMINDMLRALTIGTKIRIAHSSKQSIAHGAAYSAGMLLANR